MYNKFIMNTLFTYHHFCYDCYELLTFKTLDEKKLLTFTSSVKLNALYDQLELNITAYIPVVKLFLTNHCGICING